MVAWCLHGHVATLWELFPLVRESVRHFLFFFFFFPFHFMEFKAPTVYQHYGDVKLVCFENWLFYEDCSIGFKVTQTLASQQDRFTFFCDGNISFLPRRICLLPPRMSNLLPPRRFILWTVQEGPWPPSKQPLTLVDLQLFIMANLFPI